MPLYALTIFVSAFLLFQVQPIIAKIIVPWFGGSAAVWTTCLLFFQVFLLLGYLYAHWATVALRPQVRTGLHLGLLALSVCFLPIMPRQSWKPTGVEDPTLRILLLLMVTVGLPYFLLSTTGPLLQAWYAGRRRVASGAQKQEPLPYRLYALSNAGSMLALLSYPVLVEPHLTIRQQTLDWSLGYGLFAVLCALVAWGARAGSGATAARESAGEAEGAPALSDVRPGPQRYALWLILSACSSTLLLAVTNHLSQNVAAIPFLWVLPLSLYLLSFILCFGGHGWRWRKPFLPLPALAFLAMAYALSPSMENPSVEILILLFAGGLFVCCILCHGELARLQPHPRYLTAFYLMISLGGALGGLFVALIAPHLFRGYYEFPIGLAVCALVALFVLYCDPPQRWWEPQWLVLAGLTLAYCGYLAHNVRAAAAGDRLIARNFYGVLHVSDSATLQDDPDATRMLTNGTIDHGEQYLSSRRRREPTTYYGTDSGIGLAVREAQSRPQERVGVIGLGTGTLAAYGRPGDLYRFYEINPLVIRLAGTEFSYLRDSRAQTDVVRGDARLSLEREPPQEFDVLAVDAFSSDAIPVHLLTREAFALYFHHLKPGGVLAVHVSNRYLDLKPVVAQAAAALGKECRLVQSNEDDSRDTQNAEWVLVTGRPGFFNTPLLKDACTPILRRKDLRLWTDDYSNLYQILSE